jgi:hypothetical protein
MEVHTAVPGKAKNYCKKCVTVASAVTETITGVVAVHSAEHGNRRVTVKRCGGSGYLPTWKARNTDASALTVPARKKYICKSVVVEVES